MIGVHRVLTSCDVAGARRGSAASGFKSAGRVTTARRSFSQRLSAEFTRTEPERGFDTSGEVGRAAVRAAEVAAQGGVGHLEAPREVSLRQTFSCECDRDGRPE